MRKKSKEKKGISLIVLVITIIVMIILAATIIISLNNNGIIKNANEAVIASDIAHLKTQTEILKADLTVEALKNHRSLTQEELITAIANHFKNSTVKGNMITVENGKYDIVIEENLNLTIVQQGKYTGPIKDIDVTYAFEPLTSGEQLILRIDLLNAPEVRDYNDESTMLALTNEFLNWLDWEGLLVHAGKMLQPGANLDAATVYAANVQSILGVDFETFKANENRDALVKEKTGYDTAEILFKNMIAAELDAETLLTIGTSLLYAQDMLPELKTKTADEMELIITSWYNNAKTIDEIAKEVATKLNVEVNSFEEVYAMMSLLLGIKDETAYVFSREQAMIMIAGGAYTSTHPIIIEDPNGINEEIDWFLRKQVRYESYTITSIGKYKIKITSPSGYVVEETITLADTTVPTVGVEITKVTLNEISVETTATEPEKMPSGIKEYRYYIKGPSDATYVLKSKGTETTYTYTGLTSDVEYSIKVEVEDNGGNIGIATKIKSKWITATVNGVPIPKGFVASGATGENAKNGGLVIYEGTEPVTDENVFDAKRDRNQYVWVPVDDFSKFVRQNFDNSSVTISNTIASKFGEVILNETTNMPDVAANAAQSAYMTVTTPEGGITNTLAEVQEMYASVKEYGGFYIARYEAGLDVGSHKTEDDGVIIKTVHSKMNKAPYNWVRWTYNNAMNEDTNGAVEVARSIYPVTNTNYGVVSTLTYGVQWDRTLAWWIETKAKNGTEDVTIESNTQINNSINYGNYYDNEIPLNTFNNGAKYLLYSTSNGSLATTYSDVTAKKAYGDRWLLTTGATEEARVNNIYDIAGNLWEWTMEGDSSDNRVFRGGYFYDGGGFYPVSYRNRSDYGPYNAYFDIGFRSSLYIKK